MYSTASDGKFGGNKFVHLKKRSPPKARERLVCLVPAAPTTV